MRRVPRLVLLILSVSLLVAACGGDAQEQPPDGALESVVVFDGLNQPTTFAFLPDGRVLVAEQPGLVRVFKDDTLLDEPLIDLRERVNAFDQRGLLGLAVDPDFESNGYVYLFYTYEHDPSDPEGPKANRLVRVTVEGRAALPESEEVILGTVVGTAERPSCQDTPMGSDCLPADGELHIGGALQFASDGTLFVSTGDSAHTDDLRVRAQDLDSLAGKLLRITTDGTAPEDNPFFTGDAADNRSKVWAYGLREPFRFALQPETGLPFVGDVGSLYTEEINIASAGANLGWPCYEGRERPFGIGNHQVCRDLVQQGPDIVTAPIHTYETAPAAAVVAGDFARAYPEPYDGAFFFADFMNSWIAYLTVNDDRSVTAGEHLDIAADNPVSIRTGPDGEIYYVSWGEGELRRLRWVPAS